ncbi:flagellar basal-body MS-ring/collar protein FliF [Bacteriovorax sp. PP10]|uniref:Flagellar M-ring protein n=1 Tax=Bacteriovorax antarcticus TaxID=3088717 RepID=A0ABU5VZ07_9BACT|nr:flagellar basal-body MS-ring/collar protein FliF [Bacteriovorax sp. PP10]MEA9356805.1 flagellar basal-body MS-ring/collar protein FliF [Bacteriovorax sp. PP10]
MQDIFEKIFRNFKEFFNGLDATKKMGFIIVACLIAAAMTGIVVWASKTRYDVLYTDLNKEDARKIAIILEEKKIPYQTSNEGKTLSIPEDLVGVWRLEIAKLGTSFSGTVGYEVFDKQSFGTTSFVQKVNKQRALEGELVKSIMYIQGVKRARVHITIPESSPFVSEKKAPTASVVLELNNGVSLTPGEIKGVASLVSSSVEEMRAENVVILDDRGKKLSENIGDPMTATTANRMALEGQINQKYERQIEEILGKVVGDGKVVAKVTVDLDFTESVSTATSYDNENAAVLSEVKNSQNLNGSRPSPQGMVGARANMPGEEPQPGVAETKNNVTKELTTRNFNVPTTVTQSKKPSANVKAISAAVMIDGKRVAVLDENGAPQLDKAGNPIMKYEKWAQADLDNFQQIVASTLGTSEKRGDKLVIKNMEFAREDMTVADALLKEQANRELIRNIVKYLAVGLTISLFFFMVVRPFIQWITDNTIETVEDFLPRTLEELEKVQANQRLPGLEDALPQIEEKLNPEKIEGNMLREKIIALVENNPSKAAQIIHEMIHSSESDKQIA